MNLVINDETFGQYLKKEREKVGLTQSDVAKALDYASPQFISNWERGCCHPPLAVLPKLAKMLKLDNERIIGFLLDETEKQLRKRFRSSAAKR